jgi:hypothetical protein
MPTRGASSASRSAIEEIGIDPDMLDWLPMPEPTAEAKPEAVAGPIDWDVIRRHLCVLKT